MYFGAPSSTQSSNKTHSLITLTALGWAIGSIAACTASSTAAADGDATMEVYSSSLTEGASLPTDLKCAREGGDGASPPIAWKGAPSGTKSYAVLMYHYPMGTSPGTNLPNHYWLLWNIAGAVTSLARGNPESVGTEGSNKDARGTGYTPPCPPTQSGSYTYHIRVYALSEAPVVLGSSDRVQIGYEEFLAAIEPLSLATGELSFTDTN
jgi:phosphatidylethanolamine-binding protein (PEBP) family uncharacterized protein